MHKRLLKQLFIASLLFTTAVLANTDTSAEINSDWYSSHSYLSETDSELEQKQVALFSDGLINFARNELNIPGVVVSIVKDNQLVFAKGYGWADEKNRIPVEPDKTQFHVASISKTFTYTALMQLVEEGRVSLNDNVSNLLELENLDGNYAPVTVRQLMTHSAGFEDTYLGHFMADGEETDWPLMDYVAQNQPKRVRPGDQHIVYSNYGSSLAGALIEKISGVPFEQYMQSEILGPLGMENSAFSDSQVAETGEPGRAVGHKWVGGGFIDNRTTYNHHGLYPAGGLATTAIDITHFMTAHLGLDESSATPLLSTKSYADMHSEIMGNHPFVGGNAHGFWTTDYWGYEALEHGGSIKGFLSSMVLIPELNLGVFISTNSTNGWKLSSTYTGQLIRAFFPVKQELPALDKSADFSQYAGSYLPMRRNYSTLEAIASSPISVGSRGGYLVFGDGIFASRWLSAGDGVFISELNGSKLALSTNEQGTMLLHQPWNVLERVGFLQNSENLFVAFGIVTAVSLILLLTAFMRWLNNVQQSPEVRRFGYALIASSLLWLLFSVPFFVSFAGSMGAISPEVLARFPNTGFSIALAAITLLPLAVVLTIYGLKAIWQSKDWHWLARTFSTIQVVLSLLVLAWAYEFNLIGFQY